MNDETQADAEAEQRSETLSSTSHNEASEAEIDPESEQFWNIIDAFIDLANQFVQEGKGNSVSSAMAYASARFNAFLAAGSADDADGMALNKTETLDYFVDRYRTMQDENLEDYIEHFAEYTDEAYEE